MAESGNIDFCETTLDAAHTIRTEGGEISMTGGIAGSMNGGRISACTFTGTGVLEAAFNTLPEGYYVYAQAGGIVGSTAEASIESCTADFGGSLLIPKGGEATCNAGIVCGNSGSSITDCTAKFTGDASIESNGAISFGGAVGSLSGVGECAVSLVSTEMGGTVKIAQGDEYSDVHVGGVFGSASNATASACDALLSGDIEISSNVADGTTNVNVGGVCGKSGMLTAGCHAEWTESAHVKIASDRSNFGGVTGLTQAESNYAFLVGCYALCNGRVEIEPKNGTDYTANAGGIAGTFSGYSMIYPVVMEIPAYMDGCYALGRNRLFALRRHGPRRGRCIGGRSAQRRVLGVDARRRFGDAARQQGFRKSRSERFRSGNRRDERRDRRFDDGPTRAGRLHVRYVSGTSRPDRRPLSGSIPDLHL